MTTKKGSSFNLRSMLVTVGLVCALGACGGKEPPPPTDLVRTVKTLTLNSASGLVAREFPGRLQAATSAELSFRVSGPLVEFPVTSGALVSEGDTLAQLDPRDYQSRLDSVTSALEEAQANLSAMRAGARAEDVRALEADVAASDSSFNEAQTQYDRMEQLVADGISAQSELDSQRAVRDVAKSALDAAQERLNSGRAGARPEDIEAMEARISGLEAQRRDAAAALADTTLKAPFGGIVARTYVENFEEVQAKQAILSLQDDSAIEIIINIPESAMARGQRQTSIDEIAKNIQAEIEVSGFPGRRFSATLKDYEAEADPVTQTFAITFIMATPDNLNVRPGMNATLYVISPDATDASSGGFMIPASAVFSDPAGIPRVWRIDPATNRVAPVQVGVGELSGDSIAITSGLSEGDRVATSAANALREGIQVRSMNEPGE